METYFTYACIYYVDYYKFIDEYRACEHFFTDASIKFFILQSMTSQQK